MDTAQVASEVKTWVDFALVVWKDVWGYLTATGLGVAIGAFLPQVKIPFRKPPEAA